MTTDEMQVDEEQATSPAVRRSQRTRKATIVKPTVSPGNSDGEDSDAMDDQEKDSSDSDDDFESPKKPTPKKKASTLAAKSAKGKTTGTKRARKPKNASGLVTPPSGSEGSLFDIVSSPGAALQTAVVEWFEALEENKTEAMTELINFLLQSCGCEGRIDSSVIDDTDLLASSLEELQEDITVHDNYPIIAKKNAEGKPSRFRSSFTDFWVRWYSKVVPSLYLEEDSDEEANFSVFETLKNCLMSMSSSKFRPFRHTATWVSLTLLSCLCQTASSVHNQWMTASRQLNTQKKKTAAGTRKEKEVQDEVEELHTKKLKLEDIMKELFDAVFMHRYRDVEPMIRAECIKELGDWIFNFPDIYLSSEYLRYIGWMMCDKTPQVRLEAIKALQKLYSSETLVSGLRQFTERHKARIMEMALKEAASNVRTVAIAVVVRAAEVGLLEDDDRAQIFQLLFSEDVKIRNIIAPFFAQVWQEEAEEMAKQVDGMPTVSKNSEKWIELKSLSSTLLAVAKVVEAKEKEMQLTLRNGGPAKEPEAASSAQVSSFANSQASLLFSQSQKDVEMAEGDDDDGLSSDNEEAEGISDEALATERQKRLIASEVKNWISEEHELIGGYPFLVEELMSRAVSSLFDEVELLKDVDSMLEYLCEDFSQSVGGEVGHSQAAGAHAETRLTPEEESCLLFVLAASLRILFKPEVLDAKGKRIAGKAKDDLDEDKVQAHRVFMLALPKLLAKYGSDFEDISLQRVQILLGLFQKLDLGQYEELSLQKTFENTIRDLKTLVEKHSNRAILFQVCAIFGNLVNVETGEAKEKEPQESGRKKTPRKTRRKVDMMKALENEEEEDEALQEKIKSSALPNGLTTGLVETTKGIVCDLLEEIQVELAVTLFRAKEGLKTATNAIVSSTELVVARNLMKRLFTLLLNVTVLPEEEIRVAVKVDRAQADKDEDADGGGGNSSSRVELVYKETFDLLMAVLEQFLSFHSAIFKRLLPEERADEELRNREIRDLLNRRKELGYVVAIALRLVETDMLRCLRKACEAKALDEDENPFAPTAAAAADGDEDMESEAGPSTSKVPKPLKRDHLGFLASMKTKARKVIPVVEGILAGDPEEAERQGLVCPISVRLAASQVLMHTKMAIRGDMCHPRFPELVKDTDFGIAPAMDVQQELVKLWTLLGKGFCVNHVVEESEGWKKNIKQMKKRLEKGDEPVLRYFLEEEEEEREARAKAGAEGDGHIAGAAGNTLLVYGDLLWKMMMAGALDVTHASSLLAFYGLDPYAAEEKAALDDLIEAQATNNSSAKDSESGAKGAKGKKKKASEEEEEEEVEKVKRTKLRRIHPIIEAFGMGWDEICRTRSKILFVTRLERFTVHAVARGSYELLNSTIEEYARIIGDAMMKSLDLYFSFETMRLKPAEDLVKLLMTCLNSWPGVLNIVDKDKELHGGKGRVSLDGDGTVADMSFMVHKDQASVLSRGFRQLISHSLRRVAVGITERLEARIAKDSQEKVVFAGLEVAPDMAVAGMNGSWKVLGSLGAHIVKFLEQLKDKTKGYEGADDKDAIEDVLSRIAGDLASRKIKPSEDDSDWDDYWTFVTAIETGSAKPKRGSAQSTPARKGGAKAGSIKGKKALTSALKNSVKAKTPAKRGRPKKRSKEDEEDDDDDEVEYRPSPTKRARGVAKAAQKAVLAPRNDSEEDEEEEEEPLIKRRSSKAASKADDNENAEEAEEAEPAQEEAAKKAHRTNKRKSPEIEEEEEEAERVTTKKASRSSKRKSPEPVEDEEEEAANDYDEPVPNGFSDNGNEVLSLAPAAESLVAPKRRGRPPKTKVPTPASSFSSQTSTDRSSPVAESDSLELSSKAPAPRKRLGMTRTAMKSTRSNSTASAESVASSSKQSDSGEGEEKEEEKDEEEEEEEEEDEENEDDDDEDDRMSMVIVKPTVKRVRL
ncbi:hypothetical protein HDU97_001298 [Phlyctochytrium planicorne]|nr:hypothetical protein HDU97_001298 [Phlyctochytrium planicorne]